MAGDTVEFSFVWLRSYKLVSNRFAGTRARASGSSIEEYTILGFSLCFAHTS